MTIGEKLQRLRKAHNWTQEELAERVGVSRQSLSKWESDAALPDTANVIALADMFGVTTDYLLREDGPTPAPSIGQETAGVPVKQAAWYPSPREVGARLIVASALIGLIVLRICASFYPAMAIVDERVYSGFAGFLQCYDLWWLLWLLLIVLALGLLQWFGPRLWQQGKRFFSRTKD